MSMMNCGTAIQSVLDKAASRPGNLLVIHVEPDSAATPAALSRRLSLPLTEDAGLSFALGCAQAGMKTVLDLTAIRGAAERLGAAFAALPGAARAPLAIRMRARVCPAIPGVRVISPANARECAGAMRYALRSEEICLIVENPLRAYEACEVPDDPDELFAGSEPIPAPEEPVSEPAPVPVPGAAPEPAEEPAPEPAPEPAAPAVVPGPCAETAFRIRAYDPAELERTAALLGISRGELAALCCAQAGEKAELILETDSQPGEAACIPPEKADACLWVGRDRLTLCWKARALSAQAARSILSGAAALLEVPARLILERRE